MNKEELEMLKEIEQIKHDNKMEELRYTRETESLIFDYKKQLHRIQRADIQKSMLLKDKLIKDSKKHEY